LAVYGLGRRIRSRFTKAVAMRKLAIPIVLLLSFVACDQQPVAPMADGGPAFSRMDLNNSRVVRFQDHFATSWTDPTNGLRATHTTFPIPLFGVPEPDCGPQQDLNLINFKQVGTVDLFDFFASELHMKARGDVWIIIRDMNRAGDCYGVKLIAEGPGTIRYNDNDWLGVAPGEKATNAWSFKASGTLTTPDGRELSYQGSAHYTVKEVLVDEEGNPVPVFSRINEVVNIR
jgi:hypothetical protein